jgi:gluconolactonase
MYAAPPDIATRLFTELPPELRLTGRDSAWLHGRGPMHSFLEGPAIDRDGHLWLTDIPHGRLFRVAPDGNWTVALEYDGEPNGLAIHRDGRVFIADHRRGLLVLDPRSGTLDVALPRVRREGFKGLNDLTFASNGDLYFTDQGQTGLHDPTGRVFRLCAASGHVDCLLDNVPSPNGLALTRDERTLHVCVTRANQIWRVPLDEDGGVGRVGVFVQMSGGLGGPDGMAMDAEDNLAVAHVGLGTVWLFSRLGEPMARLRAPRGLSTTNLCYGGPEGRTLFMTESETGSVLVADMAVPGRTLYSHQDA